MIPTIIQVEVVWEHRVRIERFPTPGDKVRYQKVTTNITEEVATCLERAQRGERIALATTLGDDERDNDLVRDLEAAGVDLTSLLRAPGSASGQRWIFEDDDGTLTTLAFTKS